MNFYANSVKAAISQIFSNTFRISPRQCAAVLLPLSIFSASAFSSPLDHAEFEASLHVPFRANSGVANEARAFTLNFEFPGAEQAQVVAWRLQLINPQGVIVQTWYGIDALNNKALAKKVSWAGRSNQQALPDGLYKVQLEATSLDSNKTLLASNPQSTVPALLAKPGAEVIKQQWPTAIGAVRSVAMPKVNLAVSNKAKKKAQAFASAVPSGLNLPYTVYYGNLHSQTNHSDGGGDLSTCGHAQAPQTGAYGPLDAYGYAKGKGLDFLMTSEHNHLFDGSSSSTNASANVAVAKARYQSGLQSATSFNSSNPDFLALYGMEWGVISNGGHLNIFGSKELLAWEYNSNKELVGDTFVAKGDYAGLYTLMRQRDLIGQFNHPEKTSQFKIGSKDLAYTADGDHVMALCEVMNSSAFATMTDESDTGLSSFESACNKILEQGFHIAFSSNQDNHCANWGASAPNRTGVLIPTGQALNNANFMAALKARRVFATMDKNSQIVLTGNGRIMGERFSNKGPLTLSANFASSTGRTVAAVALIEGVPGSSGSTALLAETAQATITPKAGEHFYYAKITQDDGKILWSAPIWVTQTDDGGGSTDSQAPSVAVSVAGSSGTVQFSAKASDNVGVSKVEFYVDGALKGSVNADPFNLAFNTVGLSNGSHSLQAKAYDAAGNVGSSTAINFTVSNVVLDTTPPSVSATVNGTSGNIKLNANASDNVGVARVEFLVDNVLKGSSNVAPYTVTLDSTTLSNGNHSLLAKAYDAANNIGNSSVLSFAVNNAATSTELVVNGGFESKTTGWKTVSGVISADASEAARTGSYKAWMNGYGAVHTDTLYQSVAIPATASSAQYSFWLKVVSDETVTTVIKDTLKVQVRSSAGKVLATLASFSNLDKGSTYKKLSYDLSAYKGQTVQLYFEGVENASKITSFLVDDVSLIVK